MFERFTERARQVAEEARSLKHDCIPTEYILLGLAQTRKTVEQRQEEVLDEVRGRLGLTHE